MAAQIPERNTSRYYLQYAQATDAQRIFDIFSDSKKIALSSKNRDTASARFSLAVEAYHQLMSMNLSKDARVTLQNMMQALVDAYPTRSLVNEALGLREKAKKLKTEKRQLELLQDAREILEQGIKKNPDNTILQKTIAVLQQDIYPLEASPLPALKPITNKSWHKTKNLTEISSFSADFWRRHREELRSGEFWADKIKHLHGEPLERLKLAIENLPLPAAFREAAIATRFLIRQCRKLNEPYEDQLTLLYWLAAIDSFSIPYSEKLQMPGSNVMEIVPGAELKGLPFTYSELGYNNLKLLTKTDIKWLVEKWAEPNSHSTLNILHHEVWEKYEQKAGEKYKKMMNDLLGYSDRNRETQKIQQHDALPPLISNLDKKFKTAPRKKDGYKREKSKLTKISVFGVLLFVVFLWLISRN